MSPSNNRSKIELPDGWEDQSVHYFMGPEESGLHQSLSLQVDPQPNTDELADYARERIDQVLESIPGAEILKEEEKHLPNGVPAYEAVYKWFS